jgi:hypothetical protein
MQNETVKISGLEFKDISSEEFRLYKFPGEVIVRIDEPKLINIAKSGGHRIVDNAGSSHYVPKGWVQLTWKPKEGQPSFVF